MCMKWYLIVVWIHISFMISDITIFLCAYWLFVYPSLEKCLPKCFAHFLIGLVVFFLCLLGFLLLFNCTSPFCILGINP